MLTETQKNFRREMGKIKKVYSPYETPRRQKYKRKPTGSIYIVLLLAAIFLFQKFVLPEPIHFTTEETNDAFKPKTFSNEETSHADEPLSELKRFNTSHGLLSKIDALELNEITVSAEAISAIWEEINEHHKVSWEHRNIEAYKEVLLNGITLSNKLTLELDKKQANKDYEAIYSSLCGYVENSGFAFRYHLDYLNSLNPSDIELANTYTKLANTDSKARIAAVIDFLKHINYRHSVHDDGSVTYWYSEN